MNKQFKLYFFLFALLIVSCNDDDPERSNEVNYNNEKFTLTTGLLTSYGANGNGSFDWDVTLIGGSLSVVSGTQDLQGNGPIVYMDLNTDSSTGLVTGTYVYEDGPRAAFVMVDGFIDSNFSQNNQNYVAINEGQVEVTVGDDYTFEFDFTDVSGNAVTGYYKGALQDF